MPIDAKTIPESTTDELVALMASIDKMLEFNPPFPSGLIEVARRFLFSYRDQCLDEIVRRSAQDDVREE